MTVPVPLLIGGLVLLVLLAWLALRRRGDRDLLAPPPSLRAAPPPPVAPATPLASAADAAPGVDFESQVRALLAGGRKVEAIRRLREATGLGLAEARDWVEAVERGGAFELPPMGDEPDDAYDEVRALVATGQKLEAIKRLREATGLGLAEAKARVEAIARDSRA